MPNPGLSRTRPYPFARLRKLFEGIVPAEGKLKPISLGIGEPCHPIPQCIGEAIAQNISLMSSYPSTAGNPALREAISAWCERRYGLAPDPATEILPVLGTREALFSLVQCLVDPTVKGGAKDHAAAFQDILRQQGEHADEGVKKVVDNAAVVQPGN